MNDYIPDQFTCGLVRHEYCQRTRAYRLLCTQTDRVLAVIKANGRIRRGDAPVFLQAILDAVSEHATPWRGRHQHRCPGKKNESVKIHPRRNIWDK